MTPRAARRNRAFRLVSGSLAPALAAAFLALLGLVKASAPQADPAKPVAQEPPPPSAYDRAVALYRDQKISEAAAVLEEAIRGGSGAAGYRALLGWCYLRLENYPGAEEEFRAALAADPGSSESVDGLIAALSRGGKKEEALAFALQLLAKNPDDEKAALLAQRALAAAGKPADRRLRESVPPRTGPPELAARAGRRYFEIPVAGTFTPIFVKGVNLGVALPGKYPSEFPEDEATYRDWLDKIGKLGANVVRLYTLLPPEFYRALAAHNRAVLAAAGPGGSGLTAGYLHLIQGVWTGLPDADRYDDPAFVAQFEAEMERVVDALHGNIAVAHRPGHAFGLYREDVSGMTLAFILGREWESYTVKNFDEMKPEGTFEGRYFRVERGTAMEQWVARMMDHVVGYEAGRYGAMRPATFTNWPTLDPLHHPTEATLAEERVIKKRLGIPYDDSPIPDWNVDEDGVALDTSRIRPTSEARAGLFASYHAYPYYPDFMNLDPGYAKARDPLGPDNYVGYLDELVAHHEGIPVLIAETGVPTSRGIAHGQPQGFTHGGHDEVAQGEIDARLVENAYQTGCAGSILFAWLDEWFKHNWQVMEFESPRERNRKWLNAQDPEQNYGLLAAAPGKERPAAILDGRGEDWPASARLEAAPGTASGPALKAIWAASDEAYFYLRLDTEGLDGDGDGRIDWDRREILVGIDTYDPRLGDTRFPAPIDLSSPTGMEFMVTLAGEGASAIRVDAPYDLYSNGGRRPYRSIANDAGVYVDIETRIQITRYGRDGTIYPEVMWNRSPLRRGVTDPASPSYDSLSDWDADAGTGIFELRFPWGLLNVTDPSSLRVVHEVRTSRGEVGTAETGGFRIYAVLADPRDGKLLDTLPALDGRSPGTLATGPVYAWKGWEDPSYHLRLKKSYDIVRDRFAKIPTVVKP